MRNLRLAILVLASALLLASCVEGGPDAVRTAVVRFEAGIAATKATTAATSAEKSVSSLDVLVFRTQGGVLEAAGRETGDHLSLSVPADVELDCRVVANAPERAFAGVSSLDGFLATLSRLEDNGPGSLVKGGRVVRSFAEGDDEAVVVTNMVSRVTLGSITPLFLDGGYAGATVTLDAVYLSNVVGSVPYSMVATAPAEAGGWMMKMGDPQDVPAGSNVAAMLYRSVGATLSSAASVTRDDVFYCCPNPVDNGVSYSTAPQWSARNTRLVVVVSFDGVPTYYPIDMPAMQGGYDYVISDLRLLGPGSDHPDKPVVRGDALSFTISVNPWGEAADEPLSF